MSKFRQISRHAKEFGEFVKLLNERYLARQEVPAGGSTPEYSTCDFKIPVYR